MKKFVLSIVALEVVDIALENKPQLVHVHESSTRFENKREEYPEPGSTWHNQ